jgi:hypothetical protein
MPMILRSTRTKQFQLACLSKDKPLYYTVVVLHQTGHLQTTLYEYSTPSTVFQVDYVNCIRLSRDVLVVTVHIQ